MKKNSAHAYNGALYIENVKNVIHFFVHFSYSCTATSVGIRFSALLGVWEIAGEWEKLNAFFVQNTHEKCTKRFYFRNNCVRKRQKDKIKNYSAWQTTLYMLQSKKQRKLLTSFWFWLQQDLKLFSFVWRLIFSQIQQTISIQKNSALPWQCKNIWILQSFENAQLTFLSSS